jgi:hypothetical protein
MTTKKNADPSALGALAPPAPKRGPPSPRDRLAHVIDAEIGKKMRAMYDNLLDQPIPDRFVELLRKLDDGRENKSQ